MRIEILIIAKKMFLNRERAKPNALVPSINREDPESEVASSSRNNPVSAIREKLTFMISDETTKSFPKFNATGRRLLIKFRTPGEGQEKTNF